MKTLESKIPLLKSFIAKAINEDNPVPDSVSIYMFHDAGGGLRITEISAVWGNAGVSWMAPDAALLLFHAERFLIFCDTPPERPDGWETNLDVAQEAEAALYEALTEKKWKWTERPLQMTA